MDGRAIDWKPGSRLSSDTGNFTKARESLGALTPVQIPQQGAGQALTKPAPRLNRCRQRAGITPWLHQCGQTAQFSLLCLPAAVTENLFCTETAGRAGFGPAL